MKAIKFIPFISIFFVFSLHAQSILNTYESGVRLLEDGKNQEARKKFEEILEIRPYYYDAYVGLGRCDAAEGKEKEALEHYQQALDAKPGWFEAYYHRGLLHYSYARYRQALADFESCLENRKGWIPAMLEKARCQDKLGKTSAGISTLDAAISRMQERPIIELYITRAIFLEKEGRLQESQEDLGSALKMDKAPDSLLLRRSKVSLMLYDTAFAIRDLSSWLGKYPDHIEARKTRALSYRRMGDCPAAISDLNTLIDDMRIKNDASLFHARGLCFLSQDKPEQAVGDFTRAAASDRNNDSYYLLRAKAYSMQGKDNAALADFRRLIRFESEDPRPWIGRARYYIEREKWELALADLDEAIKRKASADAHYQRAICYWELKNNRKACQDLEAAAELGHPKALERVDEFCR